MLFNLFVDNLLLKILKHMLLSLFIIIYLYLSFSFLLRRITEFYYYYIFELNDFYHFLPIYSIIKKMYFNLITKYHSNITFSIA